MKDKGSALIDIIDEARNPNNTLTGYTRTNRACRTLGLTIGETERILYRLQYHNREGQPHEWLALKLAEREAARGRRKQ